MRRRVREHFRGSARLWRLMVGASPGATSICVLAVALQAVAVAGVILSSGALIAAVIAHDAAHAERSLLMLVIATFAAPLLATAIQVASGRLHEATSVAAQDSLALALLAPRGISHLEDPGVAADAAALTGMLRDQYFRGVEAYWAVLSQRSAGLTGFLLLARISLALALLTAVAQIVSGVAWGGYLRLIWDDLAAAEGAQSLRRAEWFRRLLVSSSASNELRLFGLQSWALEHFSRSWRGTMALLWERRKARVPRMLVAAGLMMAAQVITLGWLSLQVWRHHIDAAVLTVAVQGMLQLESWGSLGDVQAMVARQRSMLFRLSALSERLLSLPTVRQPGYRDGTEPGPSFGATVSLTDVSFRYPDQPNLVLDGINVRIPAGQSVAVVGLNGAGKSTFVKLLCGLYEPTAGTVGIAWPQNEANPAARAVPVAALFQDFVTWEASLVDNVDLRRIGASADDARRARVGLSLSAAGADADIHRLLDSASPVCSAYRGGTDLSGGQWQRVALARALTAVHDGAGLLILDEPTSALDVRAESELLAQFLSVAAGTTTVLVSHRLSTARYVDRILVLAQGRLVEDGTHEQLMSRPALYAEMFNLQAGRFAEPQSGPQSADAQR